MGRQVSALQGTRMLCFLAFTVLFFCQSHGALEDDYDIKGILTSLQKMEDRMAKLEVEDPEIEDRVAKLEDLAKIGTLRSCFEYSQYGLKTSGAYMIDPDGGLIGQEPFQVHCDFTTGCYQKNITYINGLTQEGVSMYQIVSLIELAAYCEQEIQYDCTLAPLTAEDVNYAFWEDRQGETNAYYTGSNYGFHGCDCHYEADGCIEEETKHNTCNCDANLPIPFTDTGTITNMTALPVMKLFFGGLNYELQSAAYQLGRLKCYGDKDGYYNIRSEGEERPRVVFCDMKSGTYTDVPQVEQLSDQSPLGTILAWVPHPETSLTSEELPDGWLPCNGSTITKGPWTGGKTPDLNSIGAFLRGGTEENILEIESDQIQDHQHEDPGHRHDCDASSSASNHYHKLFHYNSGSSSSHHCSSSETSRCSVGSSDYRTSDVTEGLIVSTSCSTAAQSSSIGGVDSSSRRGTETRPNNMKVSYVMRCW